MKTYSQIIHIAAALVASISALSAEPAVNLNKNDYIECPKDKAAPIRSQLGYEATTVLPEDDADEEGAIDTLIVKNKRIIARIPNAKPIAFNPAGDTLLLTEAVADDEAGYLLVNVTGKISEQPYCQRINIKLRYVQSILWAKNGKKILFIHGLEKPFQAEIIDLDQYLRKSQQNLLDENNPEAIKLEQKVLTKQLAITTKEIAETTEQLKNATTAEQRADAELKLEKYTSWKNDLQDRLNTLQQK